MKLYFLLFLLSLRSISYSQISYKDSASYFFAVRMSNRYGEDLKGKKMLPFIAKNEMEKYFTSDDLRSKITFINFWFESCTPCLAEFKALEKFYNNNKSKGGFQFVSITFEQDSTIQKIRSKYNLTYPIYYLSHDSCRIVKFNRGYPTNLIVGRNGTVLYSITGGDADPEVADKMLNYFIQDDLDKHLKVPEIKIYR